MSYVNPFKDVVGIIPERIDMGVDYASRADSALLALGDGTIYVSATSGTGWPGGGFVGLHLSDGPQAGKFVYYAENLSPRVSRGQTVHAGQVIATLHPAFPNCEVGWASGVGTQTLAAALGQIPSGDPGGWVSASGASFATLCVSLGAPKPLKWGETAHGVMPAGFPSIWDVRPVSIFPLKVGSTGAEVHQVQRMLQARGDNIQADGDYGPHTKYAVTVWQNHTHRKQTGEISQADWGFMFPLLHPGIGSTWPGVTEALQRVLNNQFKHKLTVDGDYGPATEGAVKVFQGNHGLTTDAIVGPATWKALLR